MSIREKYVHLFGEKEAANLEAAAEEHENGINSENKGSDPFKWVILICIGYECFTKEDYRKYHGITAPVEAIKAFILEYGELGSHDGDCDYLSILSGAYQEYIK